MNIKNNTYICIVFSNNLKLSHYASEQRTTIDHNAGKTP